MNNPHRDAGIPVLTEVIPNQQQAPAPEASPPAPAFTGPERRVSLQRPIPEEYDAQWNRLEREVSERVLRQVLDRIDIVLEQRVRDSLADVLQIAVEGLADQLRSGLHQAMKEVVTRAVTQEISKLQLMKK